MVYCFRYVIGVNCLHIYEFNIESIEDILYKNALLLIILLRISYPYRCVSLCHICNGVEAAGQISLSLRCIPPGAMKMCGIVRG